MERQIATIDVNGQLALPATVKAALGIHPGSQLEVSVVDHHLLLAPLEDPIAAALAMYGSGPSLEDDLIELRKAER